MNNHQVKIKINGKEKHYQHGKKKKKHYQPKEESPPVAPNEEVSSYSDEELPIIIVDESAAAAEKKEEDEFEWVLPKEPKKQEEQEKHENKATSPKASYIEDLRKVNQSKGQASPFGKKKKLQSPSFYKQLLLSIGMAIGIGTCLGFLILAVMKIPDSPLNPDVPAAAPVTSDNATNEKGTTAEGSNSFTIPAQTISVLQAGAFTTSDGATTEVNRLQSAGFPATSVGSEPTYVLMAVGKSVEGMKIVGADAADKGFEPYAKDLTFPGKTLESLSAKDVSLLEEGQSLYVQLVTATSMLLEGLTIDSATNEGLQSSLQKVEAINSSDLTEVTSGYKNALMSAYENLQMYQSSNNKQALWEAQQKLLDATSFLY
ncbi:Stage II sporulation protein B [Bacillus sp. THAF10]|uniref:hypothetical protein n=1 Tax=Bacillus sp. THAF10 TaxID=2587848 RepID=UPI001268C4A9|nr:hypothetical protein [Bacillus sp. THAF10]QFT90055.1 Stage II sporulation protein B [Bacillus sp. THAF10]